MATALNRVFLIGNLCRDPELKQAPSGTPVVDLRLAVNEVYRDRQTGESHETTVYVDVAVWGRTAENCQSYLHKGSPVLIEGRLQYDEWKNPQGETRSKLRVRADRVQFLSSGPRTDGQPAAAPHAAPPPPPATPSTPAAPTAPPPPIDTELTVDSDDLPF